MPSSFDFDELIRFIKIQEIDQAMQYLKLHNEELNPKILRKIYNKVNAKIFCQFVDEAIGQPSAIYSLVRFIEKSEFLSPTVLNELMASLIKIPNELAGELLTEEFVMNSFEKMNFFEHAIFADSLAKMTVTKEDRDFLMQVGIYFATKHFNATLLKKLLASEIAKGTESEFHEAINALEHENQEVVKTLLAIDDEQESKLVSDLMNQFSQEEFGKIRFEGALLTCVQIASRKDYTFDPVVLRDDKSEFKEYLNIMKQTPGAHQERFIIAGEHWITGDIKITKDGKVSVVFLDSLGLRDIGSYETENIIKQFAREFPQATIYFPDLPRQTTNFGCSVFALDDLRHLYTINEHLEEKYESSGLHGYAADSAKKRQQEYKISDGRNKPPILILICDLPLPLVRTTLSRSLFTTIIPSPNRSDEEKATPVNKKGEILTPEYAKNNFFKQSEEGYYNARLTQALNKMTKFNLRFLHGVHNKEAIERSSANFTLAGFRERLQRKKNRNTSLLKR